MMLKKWILVVAVLGWFRAGIFAEEPKNGELSLPWAEFERLVKLNSDEVTLSWEEFQKILKQTGVDNAPAFQMQNGNVVLSRTEFKTLLDQMKAPAMEASKYFLTKAVYTGRVSEGSTLIKAQIRVQILGKANAEALRIPVFPANMAFHEVLFDDQPALIENDGSYLYVVTKKLGDHTITARFSASSSLAKAPHEMTFYIPRTPITQINITVPTKNVDVKVANATEAQLSQVENGTLVRANLPVSEVIQLTWNPVVPEKLKAPAKVYSDVYNLLTIEEDALRVRSLLDLDILQNTINTISVRVPEGYNILDVQGDAVGDWKMQDADHVLVIPLQFARSGKYSLVISGEYLLKEKNGVVPFDGFQVLKATREKGFVGVELKTTAEANAIDFAGVDRVDTQEVPQALQSMATRPLLYGFKYLRQPYALSLDIQKHEEVAVVSTVIDEANGVTLVTEDGQRVHSMTFTVRNSWKQFLEVKLPAGAQMWGSFVDGQRVKPSKNDKGNILIPLNRSKASNGDLSSFDVELMYYQGTSDLKLVGAETLEFPIPDVVVSQMLWSVYLPTSGDYLYFGGNVDKEERAMGLSPMMSVLKGGQAKIYMDKISPYAPALASNVSMGADRKEELRESEAWKKKGDFAAGRAVTESSYLKQLDKESKFFGRFKDEDNNLASSGWITPDEIGVLPIRVNVPNTGKVFRFTKKIMVDQSPVTLKAVYWNHGLTRLLMMGFFGLLGMALYRQREKLLVGLLFLQKQFLNGWALLQQFKKKKSAQEISNSL